MATDLPGTAVQGQATPTCLVVQHLPPEGPYLVATALNDAGVVVEVCETFANGQLPASLDGYSGIVVMGGPMSAASDEGFPTRTAEIDLLGDALERGLPALGVCLGAQLLAAAAGAKVYPGSDGPEIGWGPVFLAKEAGTDLLFKDLPPELSVLHWHGDTFDLPPGATHLATSRAYPNQAFRSGPRAWGLQFHLEVDATAVDAFLAAFGDEAANCGVPPHEIAAQTAAAVAALAPARRLLLGRFAALVRGS
jgi:GMP synthase-like glutamine amidotransferase